MNARWHLSHARGYLGLGMVGEAEAELAAVPKADRGSLEFKALRVAVLHEKKDWPELLRFAQRLVEEQPDQAGWWVSFAFATRRVSSLAAARDILLQAERRHANEPIIQFNLGCYAAQAGDLMVARRRVLHAIALNEDFREIARHDPDLEPLRAIEPGFPGEVAVG